MPVRIRRIGENLRRPRRGVGVHSVARWRVGLHETAGENPVRKGEAMTDNTQHNLLQVQLETLQRWRRDAWDAFENTGDPRYHAELLAADEAVAKLLKELRDLTMPPSPAAEGLDL
jgi:hypothetical protein